MSNKNKVVVAIDKTLLEEVAKLNKQHFPSMTRKQLIECALRIYKCTMLDLFGE